MVKIASLLLAVAVAAVANASPCMAPNKCIPENIKEYRSFFLKGDNPGTYLSKSEYSDVVVSGMSSHLDNQSLKMCVVSTDAECDPAFQTHCVYENVEYRFRVEEPVVGYLRVIETDDGKKITIVKDYNSASPLSIWKDGGWFLRVAQLQPDGSRLVFQTSTKGQPVDFVPLRFNGYQQYLHLESLS
ncbi:hypothetical protein BGX24_005743 [Mortierella sp. AD032]|nr:hypothetical protein BGX24_005743 [Mortierella sp. AD032]